MDIVALRLEIQRRTKGLEHISVITPEHLIGMHPEFGHEAVLKKLLENLPTRIELVMANEAMIRREHYEKLLLLPTQPMQIDGGQFLEMLQFWFQFPEGHWIQKSKHSLEIPDPCQWMLIRVLGDQWLRPTGLQKIPRNLPIMHLLWAIHVSLHLHREGKYWPKPTEGRRVMNCLAAQDMGESVLVLIVDRHCMWKNVWRRAQTTGTVCFIVQDYRKNPW